MIEKTKDYYNGIANGYRELYHNEQIKKIDIIKFYLRSNDTILDLGSGDGVLNNYVIHQNLISCDLSIELLKLNLNHKKVNASILNLPFKDNSFSFICSFSVFQDLPDVEMGIKEVLRVLSRCGTFVFSFIKFSSKKDLILDLVQKNFEIFEKFEEEKDLMFILKKK